jgi:hypothetical protein
MLHYQIEFHVLKKRFLEQCVTLFLPQIYRIFVVVQMGLYPKIFIPECRVFFLISPLLIRTTIPFTSLYRHEPIYSGTFKPFYHGT